jgi:hypothetical protein
MAEDQGLRLRRRRQHEAMRTRFVREAVVLVARELETLKAT